VIRNAEN